MARRANLKVSEMWTPCEHAEQVPPSLEGKVVFILSILKKKLSKT